MSFIAPNNPSDVTQELAELGYLASEGLSSSIFLSLSLQRPLFLEGDPGVGKTEVAKTLAKWAQTDLIRLQCYEGLDASQALYEWDYTKQLLHLRAAEATGRASKVGEEELFYFASRGIPEDESISLLLNGFCKEVFKELPMEFAVEAQRLLEVSLEGSVG